MLIQLQLQINESERDIDGYDQKIAAYVRMNEDLQNKSDNYEKYQEQQARKQGLTRPEELILVEVPGDCYSKMVVGENAGIWHWKLERLLRAR